MPPKAREPALREGDTVSLACYQFGEAYARAQAAASVRRCVWNSDTLRCEGVVKERATDGQVLVDFGGDEEPRWFMRRLLRFVSRPEGAAAARQIVVHADSEPDSDEAESDDEEGDSSGEDEEEDADEEEADDDEEATPAADAGDGWIRDDNSANDERRRAGFLADSEPVWQQRNHLPLDESSPAYFFAVCKSWLDLDFLSATADKMQEIGRAKGHVWAGWKVTLDDVLQWIGVWFYFLAFPQNSDRRAYFQGEGSRRFGPRHLIEEWLRRGENGEKGVKWFENMEACFSMPTGAAAADDPFYLVRHMWETMRQHCVKCVSAGWLLCLDESMVEWQGRGMPGLMVVPRKPTPLGLEIHTMCDALSGILVNFEVYEGKTAMEAKEFVGAKTDIGEINKSTALTLRIMKPYFGSG